MSRSTLPCRRGHPAADVDAFVLQDGVHAGPAVDSAGVGVDLLDPPGQPGVPAAPFARLLLRPAPAVVGGGGDVQFPEGGLDLRVLVLVEERGHLGRVGSSCAAEKPMPSAGPRSTA